MKSIYLVRHGSPEQAFEIREEKAPTPNENEVRIQVEASGLNFADVFARLGLYPEAPKIPCILGYEVVGIIDSVGLDVEGFNKGERVVAFTRFGGYASCVVSSSNAIVKIPENMDAAIAAALATQYCTSWYAAEEMIRLHKGDHVLIHAAAGGVGTALVQIAKRRGCVIFGTAGSNSKLNLLKEMGVDYPIDYKTTNFDKEVFKVLGKKGLDVVFDSIGGKVFKKSMKLLSPGGRIVLFGVAQMAGQRRNIFRSFKTLIGFGIWTPLLFLIKSYSLIGVNMLQIADHHPDRLKRCIENVLDLTLRNELAPKMGHEFPVEKISEAHDYLGMRKSTGKIIIKWND